MDSGTHSKGENGEAEMSSARQRDPNPLSVVEARILACLIEKELTTPEYYPLTLNALVNACNQKSNRNPVLSLTDHDVERTLEGLRRKNLVVLFFPFCSFPYLRFGPLHCEQKHKLRHMNTCHAVSSFCKQSAWTWEA